MPTRRNFLTAALSAIASLPCMGWLRRAPVADTSHSAYWCGGIVCGKSIAPAKPGDFVNVFQWGITHDGKWIPIYGTEKFARIPDWGPVIESDKWVCAQAHKGQWVIIAAEC